MCNLQLPSKLEKGPVFLYCTNRSVSFPDWRLLGRNTIPPSKLYSYLRNRGNLLRCGISYLPQLSRTGNHVSEWASGTSSLTRKKTRLPLLESWRRYATLLQISSVRPLILSLVAFEPLQWLLLVSYKKPSSSGQFIEERTNLLEHKNLFGLVLHQKNSYTYHLETVLDFLIGYSC